jgi:uncharacterized protein
LRFAAFWFAFAMLSTNSASAAEKLTALIVDGQNNHGVWPTTTEIMKKHLEEAA